jgi:hypothetical protein
VIAPSRARTSIDRLRTRLGRIPLPKLRRTLLVLYLLAAAADATGKALAASPRVNAVAWELVGGRARAQLVHAARPSGNF